MKKLFLITLAVLISACGEDTEPQETATLLPDIYANKFLTYVNTQASLAAGVYELHVLAADDTPNFSYQLELSLNGGESQLITGDWIATMDNSHQVILNSAGGLVAKLTEASSGKLELRLKSEVIAVSAEDSEGLQVIDLPSSKISNLQYSTAYYEAVDPDNQRQTLNGWKVANGFDQGDETYVVFRDTKDLGYGRSMFARRRDDGGIAVFVDNYIIGLGGKSPANYGKLNVHAAVDQNRDYHVGTNAIEFSPIDSEDPDSPFVMKFFTFRPQDENGEQQRLLEADLDGRGIKPVPTTCIACHGGALLPLDRDGKFQLQALQTAKYNQLEVDTFEYSDLPGFTKDDQEQNLKQLNQFIFEAFSKQKEQSDVKGHWSADFAMELSQGRYGGDFSAERYDADFVPIGWRQNGSRPDGVETLYKSVVEPHCISCHSLRGTEIGELTQVNDNGELISLANAVNFSSYEKFVSFSDRIIDYVYKRGQMPLSLRNYERFWQNPQGKPTYLATFLPGFDVLDENGQVQQPGYPYAKISAPQNLTPPDFVIGQHSYFADVFQWRLVSQPAGSEIALADLNAANVIIESADDGEYVFELTVTNSKGQQSTPTQVTVTVNNEVLDGLTFVEDIRPIMGTSTNTSCSECHRADSAYPGIPAYYADSNPDQYFDVVARIDLADPVNSPILIKPTSRQHGGAIRFDLTTEEGRDDYNTVLRWIMSGAPCGNDPDVCR